MAINYATAALVLDTQSTKLKKRIKLRVVYQRIPRFYITRAEELLTDGEFANKNLKKTKNAMKEANACLSIALDIINDLGSRFSFTEFKYRYDKLAFNKQVVRHTYDISAVYAEYISTKKLAPSTRESYNTGLSWILKYKPDCVITDITPSFLEGLRDFINREHRKEQKRRAKQAQQEIVITDISKNTIGIYFRGLRAVCNYAIEKRLLEENPFKSFSLQSVPREKTALSLEEFSAICRFETEDNALLFSRDFFILSFLMGGANAGDMFSLVNANLNGNLLSFKRKKTRGTDLDITMELTDEAIEIIKKYGRIQRTKPNTLIFPFYEGITDDENKIRNKKKGLIKKINAGLARICVEQGLGKITLYNARHTYATFARDMGELTTAQIQKILGHTTAKTTEVYLSSLTTKAQQKNKSFLEDVMNKVKKGE